MNNKVKGIITAIILFLIANMVAYGCYYLLTRSIPHLYFKPNQKDLGAAIVSYSGTFLAILIAAFTFLSNLDTKQMRLFRKYDYINGFITLYGLVIFELGATFFAGIMCFSTITYIRINSLAIGLSVATFIQILMLLIQLINLSRK